MSREQYAENFELISNRIRAFKTKPECHAHLEGDTAQHWYTKAAV